MVAVQKRIPRQSNYMTLAGVLFVSVVIFGIIVSLFDVSVTRKGDKSGLNKSNLSKASPKHSCAYKSLHDLAPDERYPKASQYRHIVDPPIDTKFSLVCCETTAGSMSIAVHHSWAPLGAQRFIDMVTSQYFSNRVPLMRCVKDFLCQFGLAGSVSKQFNEEIPDDPQWLPPGPKNRKNELDAKRFQKGYFSYAGGGPNSRSQQLFVALADSGWLGGGSPWEVPWGELVGKQSYDTLEKIYTGYGEDGPKQEMLQKEDALAITAEEFPLIDYVLSCVVVDEDVAALSS